MLEREMRASDATREQIVSLLSQRFAEGYLSSGSFADRVDVAYGAKTVDELEAVVGDLPRPQREDGRRGDLLRRISTSVRRLASRRREALRLAVEFPLGDDSRRIVVGRNATCDVVLTDATVSRVHAELVLHGGRWMVRDLGSKNGTRLNGRQVGAAEVWRGDMLMLGTARPPLLKAR